MDPLTAGLIGLVLGFALRELLGRPHVHEAVQALLAALTHR